MRKSAPHAALTAPPLGTRPAADAGVPHRRQAPPRPTLAMLWARWKVVAHRIGDFQARLLLAIFYYGVLGPFALGVKLFSDPLRLRRIDGAGWVERPAPAGDPARAATRQF